MKSLNRSEMVLKFKSLFEEQKRNLTYSQTVLDEKFDLVKDDMLDEVDMSTTELETSMRMRLRNREALFLKKIDQALERIQEGSFGACSECGDDIELKRLEVRPTATHCVHCKEEQERLETSHIDGHRHKSLGAKVQMA